MKKLHLDKMVGPLPVGAWLAVLIVGLGLAYTARRRAAIPEPSVATTPQDTYPSVEGSAIPLGASYVPLTAASDAPLTNAAWVVKATQALVGRRSEGPFTISQALSKYVAIGTTSITAAERAIVEDAIRRVGLPPDGVGQITVTVPATSPTTPATPTGLLTLHWTLVRPGETPNKIATRLRTSGALTADGKAITANYLIRMNQWGAELEATRNKPRWPGEPVKY